MRTARFQLEQRLLATVNALLGFFDAKVIRKSKLEELQGLSPSKLSPLPAEAAAYLQPNNPRLLELRDRYESLCHPAAKHSMWTRAYVQHTVDLQAFRGESYLWQFGDLNTEARFYLTAYYIQSIDSLGLLQRLAEDGLFGAFVFDLNGELMISRDLLDSIVEIYFLERTLGISSLSGARILDIGAGYGRLAHRMARALPYLERYLCVDAVPESTFIAEYYLPFRKVDDRAQVVPLYAVEETLRQQPVDLAININCFSECTLASIEWWLDLLARHEIPYLMIVPNGSTKMDGGKRLLSMETNGSSLDFLPALEARGYQLEACQPKYLDSSIQRCGVSPTWHYLFRRR